MPQQARSSDTALQRLSAIQIHPRTLSDAIRTVSCRSKDE
jgi:hypothetical protein